MNIINNQLLLFSIFLLCIILITYLHLKNQNNEKFENNNLDVFNDNEITNNTLKIAINSQLDNFNSIINKYSKLDPNITVDNNGILCDNSLPCKKDSKSNDRQCLVNNSSSSCSSFFSDGQINSFTNLDIQSLNNSLRTNIINNSSTIITSANAKQAVLDNIINIIVAKLDLIKNQEDIILHNNDSLNDKKNKVKNINKDFEKNENDVNINQYNFKNFLIKNDINNNKISLYRSILYGLIIAIIVTGILLYFIS